MSTNLKMHLKPSVQEVWQNLESGRYTVGGTLVGKAVPKLNLGRVGGWLEIEPRGIPSGKVAHWQELVFGSSKNIRAPEPLAAKPKPFDVWGRSQVSED